MLLWTSQRVNIFRPSIVGQAPVYIPPPGPMPRARVGVLGLDPCRSTDRPRIPSRKILGLFQIRTVPGVVE